MTYPRDRRRDSRPLTAIYLLLAVLLLPAAPIVANALADEADEPVEADILLRGGLLYRGDGGEPAVGDVAIRGDRIVAVGKFTLKSAGRVIDCQGLAISPGFIDLHNHSDRQVRGEETRAVANYLFQGCTTIVTGNCGSGPIEVGEYYDHLQRFGVGVNVAHLLPQGQLRREVIGSTRRGAEPEELKGMLELTRQAMDDGAWGVSTGLIYVPSSYADTDELAAIAKVVGEAGGIYVSHIRNENTRLLEAVDEALEIGRRGGAPVHISHFKSSGKNSWGLVRVASQRIEKLRAEGARITADQYPYTASSTSLDATMIPASARAGGRDALRKRLADEFEGPKIRKAIENKLEQTDGGQRIQIASYRPRPDWVGKRLSEIAAAEEMEPLELVLQIVDAGGASVVNHSINEEDVRYVMNLPWVATASDGSARVPAATAPHPRSYGTFARKLGHYAIREKAVDLSLAVRSCSGLPADILGMTDRGYLRSGAFADIAVWSPRELIDQATFERPHRYCEGVRYLFVNGRPAIHEEKFTGALAGRPLRRPASEAQPAEEKPSADESPADTDADQPAGKRAGDDAARTTNHN